MVEFYEKMLYNRKDYLNGIAVCSSYFTKLLKGKKNYV